MAHYLTADQLGQLLGLDPETIYRYGRAGTWPTVRFGRTVRFLAPEPSSRVSNEARAIWER
jgi:predicted DNA-binding transcriptional regulator AlpA